MRRGVIAGLLVVGCASKPAEEPQASASVVAPAPAFDPPATPTAEPVETGQACAKATAICDGGSCTLKLKNDCEQALTCDGFVLARCRTPTDAVEARGRGRQTFAAKAEAELTISTTCTMGKLVGTELAELKCK